MSANISSTEKALKNSVKTIYAMYKKAVKMENTDLIKLCVSQLQSIHSQSVDNSFDVVIEEFKKFDEDFLTSRYTVEYALKALKEKKEEKEDKKKEKKVEKKEEKEDKKKEKKVEKKEEKKEKKEEPKKEKKEEKKVEKKEETKATQPKKEKKCEAGVCKIVKEEKATKKPVKKVKKEESDSESDCSDSDCDKKVTKRKAPAKKTKKPVKKAKKEESDSDSSDSDYSDSDSEEDELVDEFFLDITNIKKLERQAKKGEIGGAYATKQVRKIVSAMPKKYKSIKDKEIKSTITDLLSEY
jgi:hypothetical protein